MENINQLTADIATILTFSATIYVTILRRLYNVRTISLLWIMSVTSFTWGRIPLWVNDMMYDAAFILIVANLVYLTEPKRITLIQRLMQNSERRVLVSQLKEKWDICCSKFLTLVKH